MELFYCAPEKLSDDSYVWNVYHIYDDSIKIPAKSQLSAYEIVKCLNKYSC